MKDSERNVFYVCLRDSSGAIILTTEYGTLQACDDAFHLAIEGAVKNRESGPYSTVAEITKGRIDEEWGPIRYAKLTFTDDGKILR